MRISELPMCVQRCGRMTDKNMVICCGFRNIDEPEECIFCGGFIKSMIIGRYK